MHLFKGKKIEELMLNSNEREELQKCVNVLVLGESGVGKTEIVKQLCNVESLDGSHDPTVYDVHIKEVLVDEYNVSMHFMDFGGSFVFPSMENVFIRQADIFLLVYSAADVDSFHKMLEARNRIVKIKGKHSTELPIVVVRNKCDLKVARSRKGIARKQSVLQWCYLEHDVSAKTGLRINAVMESLIEESKLIGNAHNLDNLKMSGRFIYGQDDVVIIKQFHRLPTLFRTPDNSDEMMEKRQKQSYSPTEVLQSPLRRSNVLLRSLRRSIQRSTTNQQQSPDSSPKNSDVSSETVPESPIKHDQSSLSSFEQDSASSSRKKQIRRKSLSSNDLVTGHLPTLHKKSTTFPTSTELFKPWRQSSYEKKRRPDIVHTTLSTDALPENHHVPIFSRTSPPTTTFIPFLPKTRSFEEEMEPRDIYPVPAWRGSNRVSLYHAPENKPTSRLQIRRKSASTGDLLTQPLVENKQSTHFNQMPALSRRQTESAIPTDRSSFVERDTQVERSRSLSKRRKPLRRQTATDLGKQ